MNKKLAEYVSLAFMPQISSTYSFALLFAYTKTGLVYLALAVFFSSVIPLISLSYYSKVSRGDAYVIERKNRSGLFAIAILSYFTGFIFLKYASAPFIFSALMLCYLLNTIVAALITKYFSKVSIHVWGISGPSVAIFYYYGLLGLASMLLLAAIVGIARINLNQHTKTQVLLSFVFSVPITFFIIYVLSPLII